MRTEKSSLTANRPPRGAMPAKLTGILPALLPGVPLRVEAMLKSMSRYLPARTANTLVRKLELRGLVRATAEPRVILGAGGFRQAGWIATDIRELDITKELDWRLLFSPDSIHRLLAEHVLEHLTPAQTMRVLRLSRRYLRPGGLLRIAVPDGYRRDPAYRREVMPPKDGHQQMLNVDRLCAMIVQAGLEPVKLEYFDARERFHARRWDVEDGMVRRSVHFDGQKTFQRGTLYYTSLLVDAVKR
ncbi:MAG: hypothetical protein IT443_02815 [Phycisphaeraceae bacterium]|nr:hypothetical protein [Phycisphaeraceae bacterium]